MGFIADRPCLVCGDQFTVTRRANARKAKYCSSVCAGRGSHGLGPRDPETDMRAAFERYVLRQEGDECWDWAAFKHRGYGRMSVCGPDGRRRSVGAHRVSYLLHVGPIPDGLTVLHSCDNPPCTNPAHLFLGTNADNNFDRDAKQRTARGERIGVATLTDDQVARIRADKRWSNREWANHLGVDWQAVYAARTGRTWQHLNDNHPPCSGPRKRIAV